ncbi:hypothetical protein DPEC_G00201120 [Dallia pectoralis]|uniref:Uncharacterized protein n=1 Tax=Dallia pectoralis TaxID=75939 RepID=A0ACC2G8Y5_DALPE|nr:hypothetical protein DPEC_G00201120 [Dallia pectoralis]
MKTTGIGLFGAMFCTVLSASLKGSQTLSTPEESKKKRRPRFSARTCTSLSRPRTVPRFSSNRPPSPLRWSS